MGLLKAAAKLNNVERLVYNFEKRHKQCYDLIAIIRVRNESLILSDTLNHLSSIVDGIIAFDDASTDNTFEILKSNSSVISIIRNLKWRSAVKDRLYAETEHRSVLLQQARLFSPKWILYSDADERFIGDIRSYINSPEAEAVDAVRISLFDAYMTETDMEPFKKGDSLLNFRKYFGPERRDILMLWKNIDEINYQGYDSREPYMPNNKNVVTKFLCQHYGKSLSIAHWEETCNYYLHYFPYEEYGKKWEQRKGKAIHLRSDFDNSLIQWGPELFNNSIKLY